MMLCNTCGNDDKFFSQRFYLHRVLVDASGDVISDEGVEPGSEEYGKPLIPEIECYYCGHFDIKGNG